MVVEARIIQLVDAGKGIGKFCRTNEATTDVSGARIVGGNHTELATTGVFYLAKLIEQHAQVSRAQFDIIAGVKEVTAFGNVVRLIDIAVRISAARLRNQLHQTVSRHPTLRLWVKGRLLFHDGENQRLFHLETCRKFCHKVLVKSSVLRNIIRH